MGPRIPRSRLFPNKSDSRIQRYKALCLAFLMIALAQTSYIGVFQGWSYLEKSDVNSIGPGCSFISRTSGTPIYVDSNNGSDSWSGTWSCPKATLSDALNDSVANDEIVLYSGLYHENVTVDNKDNLVIRAAEGARVVFDGTQSISEDFDVAWGTADSNGIQEVTLPVNGWQLFLAYDEQVPARWPNAQFSNETVFNRSYWAEGTLTGSNNAYTKGWLTDAGPESGVHTGLNETINATGLNPVGAIAVMNLGSFRSNSREITAWNSANGTFAYDGNGVGWKTKHHAYFLEGKRELIDVDGEWWFDNSNNRLHYKTPSGQDANDLDLRVKVQPFSISVENSDGVTIQGIDFFGTTVNFNNCDRCSFTNSTLEYPSTSKRGLGITGESEDDRWMTRFYRSTNSFVDNISIINTDGGALEFQGSPGQSNNNTVNNSYFHAIDWSAADQKGLMVTIYEGGRDMYFTNNTIHLTGASSVLSIGDAPKVFYNEVWDVGHLQTDGAVVQVMQAEAPGAEIAYNWIHDVIKYGARFDAPIGQAGEGRNGTMHHNVMWNTAGGLMVKGDYHDVHNNTVFNSTNSKNDVIVLTDGDINNKNSTIHRNAVDTMADHRSDSWSLHPLPSGTYWNNWNGYVNTTDTVSNQLVDPINNDFRPKTNSHLDNMSAGAYDADDSDPWTAGVSWTYSPMSNPISDCMDSIAINYNSNAVFADGSCIYTALTSSSSTLSLEVGVSMTPYTLTYSTPFLADDKQTAASAGSTGLGTNIALDSNGAVHICSKTVTTDNLYYTTNASGSWQSATLDSSANVGGDCFIILDSDDDIHITYYDDTNNVLKYATKALSSGILSTNWAISTMDNNGDVGNFGSMAVDAEDNLHVAYYRSTGSSLKYATLVDGGSTWSKETIESTNNIGKFTSIALDSNGKPHITYRDVTNTNLRYAHKMGSSWVTTTLDSTSFSGTGTSLAIDSNDNLHVAYKTNSTEIAYLTNQSGSWVKTTLDANSSGSWLVNYVDIMISDGDIPHIVYYDAVDHDIFYMSNARGVWERILVAGDSISKTPSATMDENGGIHVAYHIDGSYDDIGYAAVRSLTHRPQFEIEPTLPIGMFLGAENGTIYGTPSVFTELTEYTVWANTTSTSASTTLSMNVDWELMASVDYLEVAKNTAITPITFNWTAWSSEVINSTSSVFTNGDSGQYSSIAVDSNGKVHIVFYRDDSNEDLMYSTNKSGSWVTTTIDSQNNVGQYCSLAIDSANGLHVSYHKNEGNDLKYAYKSASSSTWTKTIVDGQGGKFTSIALDSNDKPHISYRDSGGDLAYAEKTGNSWNFGSVQSAGNVDYTSIAIDSDNHIHIAYYDSSTYDMYHLTNTSGSWARNNLEDIGESTGGTSLDIAIDPTTDEPGISYFDMDAKSLKYKHYTGSSWSTVTVKSGPDYGRFNSIAYDSLGNVHISHERNSADDLYYSSDKTGSWVSTPIHTTNSAGTHTSIAIDGNDDIHIAYRYNTGADLYHATVQGHKTSPMPRADVSRATCSISPSLPNGLILNQGTCSISGTPTVSGTNTTYNVTATSSTGLSKTGEFKIWVTMVAPSISYTGTPFTFNKDVTITPVTPVNSGDSATWSVSPSLPLGLNIDSSTGLISGTPTATSSSASYVITATNSGGSATTTISITVHAQSPSSLSYSTENMTLEKGTAMAANTPSVSGGTITSWEISPSVPTGLVFNPSTGAISGTPSVLQTTAVTYTVWANNSGGSASANINITVNDVPPVITYSPNDEITGTKAVPLSPHVGPSKSGGAVTSWAISPNPGSAFHFNSGNGYISGTPGIVLARTQYTIWANNSGGSSVAYVNVTISDVGVTAFTYPSENITLARYHTMTTATPSTTGGTATSWGISPNLPSGLSLNSVTGAISGTPENLQTTAVTYTVWANNSGGSFSDQINITINDHAPAPIHSFEEDITLAYNQTLTPIGDFEMKHDTMALSEDHSCAIKDDGTVRCWGHNAHGGLGIGSFGGTASWPQATNSLGAGRVAIDISVGGSAGNNNYGHTCALLDDGSVVCWGRNNQGQLGDNSTTNRNSPTPTVPLPRPAVAIETGFDFTCALLDNGSVMCWGWGSQGRLGNGGANSIVPTYTNPFPGGRYAVSIDISHYHACAVLNDGHVACWGPGGGYRLGTGSEQNKNSPTLINYFNETNRAVDVALGRYTGCGLLDDGRVTCWGQGYLGNGGSLTRDSPGMLFANLGSGRTAVDIEMGRYHACAILDNGNTKCWGDDKYGQMANGNGESDKNNPTIVNFATGIEPTAVYVGHWHTCITAQTNEVYCWGDGEHGKLGDGSTAQNNWAGASAKANHFSGNNPVLNHGSITSWAIHPALPTGLLLGSTNGTLYGTPTASIPAMRTYTIFANNSGGSTSTTIRLMVKDEVPNISYSPDWFVLTNNTAMSPIATPTNTGGAIPSTIIDSTGNVGEYSSIVIDSYGFKHISYYDATNTKLKYATDKSGSWVHTTVNTHPQMGRYTSIAIDSEGYVHISYDYHSMFYKHLMYATDKSGSWVNTIADGSAEVGSHSSIAVDSNDVVHISYYDYGGGKKNLKYATCSSSCSSTTSWAKVIIDVNGDVGKYNSIAVDSNDALHISYRDSTNDDLKYAKCSSSCTSIMVGGIATSWTISTIDSVGNVGSRTSIAIDSNDAVHISYHDITNGDLKYATDQSGSWANTTVDSVGTVGQYTSIAIDSNDVVHISYYDATNKDLKYATNMQSSIQTGVGGVIKFVDRGTKVGHQGTSIAVDSNGDVHISYYDATNGDLKYAALQGVHPWNVYGYSISPALPAGLSLNFISGEISGTPTALSTNTTYTITARNSGGVDTTTITIEVLDQLPGLSYSPKDLTLTNNTVSSDLPLAPTLTGPGEITSWAINSTLPSGLNFGTNNGTIWGIPTQLFSTSNFTIWANNSGGSTSAEINITIVDELPSLSYSPHDLSLTNNTVSSDLPLAPTLTGPGEITSWAINATLPSGLNFGTNNGTIWGIPTQLLTTTNFTIWANNSGGSSSTEINITIVDELPSLSYSPDDLSLTNNTVSSDLPLVPSLTGPGEITSWAINATLPSGLNFGLNNGTIWGIPTQLLTTTNYTIWANNSGGSSSAEINITIVDQIPVLSYSPSTLELTNNTVSSDLPLAPTLAGPGEITSWAINSTLPSGLNFGTNNGTIWGIPTQLLTTTNFTIWANNSGGSTSAEINITIVDELPSLSYSPDDLSLTNNTVSSDLPLVPTLSGSGEITSWAINASLPSGLNFGTNNGTIWGIPTQLFSTSNFTIWANNSGGSISAEINITIVDQIPVLSYSPSTLELTNNTVSSDLPLAPTLTGPGEITSWEINATLPAGLNFGTSNGTIWGIPTQLFSTSNFTIWANNSGGSVSAEINITIVDQIPVLSYSPSALELTNNTVSSDLPLAPTLTGPGEITSWAINATLPSGLNFGTNNGTVWGIPTQLFNTSNFTIWANNSGGSTSAEINITIVDQVPVLSYVPSSLNLSNNTVSSDLPLAPTLTGPGEITSWAINATLPSGLNFGTSNGTIWGIPTQLFNTSNFTIWANNSGGSTSAEISITIIDELPSLSYSPTSLNLTNNTASIDLPLAPTLTGAGEITSWEINASLPSGLNFGTSNGTIWGIPTQLFNTSNFTIWANNSGGSSSAEINITIVDQVPVLSYVPSSLNLTNNTVSIDLPLNAILTGPGEITSWEINATLPSGLNFGLNNGTIWGVPTQLFNTSNFTIWANNSGGSSSAEINITIVDQVPVLSYVPNSLNLTNNTVSSDLPLAPTLTGPGEITSWEINATLPAGLNFGTSNGTIWGIPTQLFTTSNFTIWANNSGGSTSVELNITIVAQLPALSYSPTSLNLTNNTVSSDLPMNATLVGSGEITSWAINATLPSGLNFGTNNGTIWGVPTQLFNTSNFTIWANNSGGSLNATITLTIVDQLPQLSYTPSELVLTNNTDSSEMPMVPYLNGSGEILTWELEGTLPSGLNFETSNGTIWGIANELMPSTNYTIWANNSGGSASTQISITVVDQLPNLSYIPNTLELTNNTESEDFPLEATLIGNGEILTWELSSELPEGLLFGQNNGTFWGVPTELYPPTNFTVWANNSGGSVSANITITVFDQVPVVSYDPSTVALLNDSSVLQLIPISTGGAISSWTIDPQPSPGLYFDTETGIFAGTPIQTAASVQYLITASNDVGSISVTVNITVEDLEYELMNGTLMLVNNSILHAYPPISEIFSAHYEIEPDLPDGLYFDSVNGTIWGTPIEVLQSTIFIVYANNTLFNDTFSVLIEVVEDTDLDGLPDDLSGFDSFNGYIEDLDDDDDGFSDIMEVDCISDPLDENSIPNDLDGDGICDALDIDLDGDGLYNIIEDNSSVFKSKFNPGTNPTSPDSDGDGVCDGPKVPANGGCTLGPDAFPLDPSAHTDTDGDGKPDNMFGNSISEPPLELDMDDDNDRWTDADEVACGTDSLDELSIPNDTDGDGICDNLDDVLDLPFNLTYPNTNLTLTLGEEMNAFLPNVTGLGGVSSWEIVGQLPGGLTFGERQARASSLDGGIRGTPNETLEPTEYTIWANNSLHHRWYKITLQVSEDSGAAEDEDSPIQWGYLFCPLIILILVFIVLVLIPKEKVKLKDAEPKNTKSKPKCKAGLGTKEEPFILRSATAQSGELLLSKETIIIDNISPANLLDIVDLNKMSNGGRFRLANLQSRNESSKQGENLVSKIPSSEFGVVQFKLAFDDRDEPTEGEQTYHAKIKVGNESVYFKWDVEVE